MAGLSRTRSFAASRRLIATSAAMAVALGLSLTQAPARDADVLGDVAADSRGECPAGSAMVGLSGKAGADVTGLVARCVEVTGDGRWRSSTPVAATLLGADDPALGVQTVSCAQDSFVSAIGALASAFSSPRRLTMIWIQCGNRGGPQQTAGQSIIFTTDIEGSVALGTSQCAADELPVGIAGHAGAAIEALALVCNPVRPNVASVVAPGSLLSGTPAPQVAPQPATPMSGGPGSDLSGGPGSDLAGGPGSDIAAAGPGSDPAPTPPPGMVLAVHNPNTSIAAAPIGATTTTTTPSTAVANLPEEKLVSGANVRAEASMDGRVIETLAAGTVVRYGEKQRSWCHVYYNGKDGWISTTLIGCGGKITTVQSPSTVKPKPKNTQAATPPQQQPQQPPPAASPSPFVFPGGIGIILGN